MSEVEYRTVAVKVTRVWKGAPVYGKREPELPGRVAVVKNFARSVGTQAAGMAKELVATGETAFYASDAEAERRHQVCRGGCEFYRKSDDRCGHPRCGCFMKGDGLLSRTRWKHLKCPEGKW